MESTRLHWLVFVAGLWMTFPAQAEEQDDHQAAGAQRSAQVGAPPSSTVLANTALELDGVRLEPSTAPTSPTLDETVDDLIDGADDALYASRADDADDLLIVAPTIVDAGQSVANESSADVVDASPVEGSAAAPDVARERRIVPRRRTAASVDDAGASGRADGESSRRAAAGVPWYRGPYAALGGVLALIAAATVIVRRFVPSVRPIAADALTVVGRAPISAKQSAVLLHVGNRLVVVGVSSDGMRTLAEITDPQEVSLLLGRTVGRRQSETGFDALLADQLDRFDDEPEGRAEEAEAVSDTLRVARGELATLRTRIRALHSA